jgi:hypothetical protein
MTLSLIAESVSGRSEASVTERSESQTHAAEPPGGGRQDHDVMHDAAMRPVTGPASTNTLAAIGGLQVPGREPHAPEARPAESPHEPIPGERDASTLTHREPGAIGGQFAGADIPATAPPTWMDKRTATEHAREGGGDAGIKSK